MPSIVTVTINPTIDKSTTVPALVPEKKLQCSSPVLEPGGGGINVARAIKKLGGDAIAIFLAGGYNGTLLNELLVNEGVNAKPVEINNATRENIIVLDTATNQQYRFGMPGPEVVEPEWHNCLKAIEEIDDIGFLVASGSLSPGVPVDIFARIAKIAKSKNAKLILDTSGEALKLAVNQGAYLIKPNLGELAFIAGKEELDPEQVVEIAREIIEKECCQVIMVSMGPAGAMMITKDMVQQINAPSVRKKSTVGAGDSMVAGIVLSLSRGFSLPEAVRYGVASGTAATMNPGTQLCRLEDVERLYKIMKQR
jgi:6-phosphofructokinase 2